MSANRITLEDIQATVRGEQYYVFPETTLTVCCLTLQNGYTVTGESACVDPVNFNKELGEKYARDAAVSKIWQLEGYLLRDQMHHTQY